VYAVEKRQIPGREAAVDCVLLDSVQSQANRMELALQEAIDANKITIPLLEVDFRENDPTGDIEADKTKGRLIDAVGKVTSLQVSHRLADAILRDSQFGGVDFRDSEKGRALNTVSWANATPMFELCPTALVFGMWDSTGPKGGLGPKPAVTFFELNPKPAPVPTIKIVIDLSDVDWDDGEEWIEIPIILPKS
jgi:CRISPR-associated protein Csb1